MEASSLKIKKQIQKGKLKTTLKNVLCQPDSNFWPLISENEGESLTEELNKLKVEIPDFKKPHWSEISQIPKESRPKPPPIPKVNGLIFGITECKRAIEAKECIGILIDAEVTPKTIVQPLIDICLNKSVPVLCLKQLKITTDINFGISTSVLGVRKNLLSALENKFLEVSESHKSSITKEVQSPEICDGGKPLNSAETSSMKIENVPAVNMDVEMKTIHLNPNNILVEGWEKTPSPYLYRVNKTFRIFSPSAHAKVKAAEEFIKVTSSVQKEQTPTTNSKQFMKIHVKKISSNLNRRKVLKPSSKD